MRKTNSIYEARIPVTHYKGDGRAEWVVGVKKVGRSYSVYGTEYAFCHIDNKIIGLIFESYKDDLIDFFYGLDENGTLTRKAEYTNAGSANTYLSGIKNKDTALQLAKWLEAVASGALSKIPSEELDREKILWADNEIKVYKMISNHQAETLTDTLH